MSVFFQNITVCMLLVWYVAEVLKEESEVYKTKTNCDACVCADE